MAGQVVAQFLVDRPVRPGMVRAILDTLSAQGGAYAPQLVRRSSDAGLRHITWSRPAGLLDEVTQGGSQTTFLRVAEGQPQPVVSFQISASPRTRPSQVSLTVPDGVLTSSQAIEQVLGVSKGLYLFLESPWGFIGLRDRPEPEDRRDEGERSREVPRYLQWANFIGPQAVTYVGPARLLTSMAFIIEILPDGGIMLVTHPTPHLAETAEGRALRFHLEGTTGVEEAIKATGAASLIGEQAVAQAGVRIRRGVPRQPS